ncbi:MAG TPA: hypothetical protein VKB51_05040 [bacterium]|nr:hypothetical protein [bacterium]
MDRFAATGATLVVANIPDVATLPYLTSAEMVQAISGVPMAALGLQPGD